VLAQQGENEEALSILSVALEGFTQMDVHQSRAECMRTMGDVYVRRGDICLARKMWAAARPLFERSEQKKGVTGIDARLQTLNVAQKLEEPSQVELAAPRASFQDSGVDSNKNQPILIADL
jgi:hypothetical protein